MNASPLEKVLSAIGDYKPSGKSYKARCPAHDDKNPSLSICAADDGRVLLKCHAGCTANAIVTALGLTMRELFPSADVDTTPRNSKETGVSSTTKGTKKKFSSAAAAVTDLEKRFGAQSASWTYHDADGEPVGMIIRWDKNDGKIIQPVAKTKDGWIQGGMPTPRPLYRLPELLKSSGPVFAVEGEKAADALHELGFTVTTSAHGAKSARGTDWKPLAGREVIIPPDNDRAGAGYAEDVIDLLVKRTPRPSIKILRFPILPVGGDAVDFIAARRAAGLDDAVIRAEIQKMVDDTEMVQHEDPEPNALAYQPFPVELLPEPIHGYVQASAAAIGCDPAFVAVPILAAIASAIGASRRIRLKRQWTEPAIIWALTIAPSGSHKSPGHDAAVLPVKKRQEKTKRRFAKALKRYEADMEEYKKKLAERKAADADDPLPERPEKPIWERCWTEDTTIEALAPLLLENPRGLLLACDELSAWFASFDRYSKANTKTSADAARWLHIHGGRALAIDRKTGDPRTIFVPHATTSVAGCIQPAVFKRTFSRENCENGMFPRFLVSMPSKRQKRWTEAEIDLAVEADVLALFDRLCDLQPVKDEDGEPIAKLLNLSPAAKHGVWIPFYNELGKEQNELDDDLSATWSKLECYAARLALVHYLIRVVANDPTVSDPDTVDATSMKAGIALSRWFGQEAKRVYVMLGESEEDQQIRELVDLVERLGGTVTGRDLQRRSRKYRTANEAEGALQLLVQHEKGDWQPKPGTAQGGRPTMAFVLHRVDTTSMKPGGNGGSVNVNGEAQASEWG